MNQPQRFPVVLLWHMHQPHYKDALSNQYILPWTYLHAIKDYVDMAAHLEANPGARAVVNFTPVLIEQLEELADRVTLHLAKGTELPDPLLAMLGSAPLPQDAATRMTLVKACLKANRERLIDPYPAFARLAELAGLFGSSENIAYVSDQYLRDLAVWYHLAWLGETVKRGNARVAALMERQRDFTPQHCRSLLELIGELLVGVIPRYRRLAEQGRCELAVSPYGHPILPLLHDFNAARESNPGSALPRAPAYPGGDERAEWHMREAVRVFERAFGRKPRGCWPSEGAISASTLQLIDRCGFDWLATGGAVLHGCLAAVPPGGERDGVMPESHGWSVPGQRLSCFFRHDDLSDTIGFVYSKWHGDDAVRHFVQQLENAAKHAQHHGGQLLLIALDGENAWEYYPFNGFYFLQGLYAALASHPWLQLQTLSEYVDSGARSLPLQAVVAGSWVHGTLATWMGDRDKNAGWDLLVEAKQAVDKVLAARSLSGAQRQRIERQLALCESSDWFWWFGDYNPSEAVQDFDMLYRHQLALLYQLLGQTPPASLSQPLSTGRRVAAGERDTAEVAGVMRRAHE
ncbi:MAG: glycoside hydrolase family 57 protein [Steroidobacteraceae bacterium]